MTALAEACSDLEQWLPRAAALIPERDVAGTVSGRVAPGSRPPWNSGAADLVLEITAGLRDIEAGLLAAASGLPADAAMARTGSWSRRCASARLASITRLGHASDVLAADGCAQVSRWVNRIMTMPAIDAAEPDNPIRVRRACPFCRLGDLRMMRRSFRVTCLRLHECADRDGLHPRGVLEQSRLDGQWRIYWHDGSIT